MTPGATRAAWRAVLLAGGVVALRVFDLVLLKRYLDSPWQVALWVLVAPALLLLAARGLARRVPAPARTKLQRHAAALDGPALALVFFCLLMLFLSHWGHQRARSDGREYFVQVRSLVMDLDLDFANENAAFGVRGTADRYAFGSPLLWVPWFLLAHVWLGVLNLLGADYLRDGFFNPYQRAVGLGSLVYGCAGLGLLFQLASGYFRRSLAAAAIMAVCAGSFLGWYFVVDATMPHAISMASVALVVWLWHRTQDGRSARQWMLLGLCGGLMMAIRWQNIAFLLLPAADAVRDLRRLRHRGGTAPWQALRPHAGFAAAALLGFSPQMIFWKLTRGGWLAMPTAEHAVQWTAPLRDALFSPNRGLFAWSPLLLFALAGAVIFTRSQRRLGALLLIAFAAQVYILGTVDWSGYGFGARRFANATVLFVLGLAAMLDWFRRRPLAAPAVLLAGFVGFNVVFMSNTFAGRLPASGTVRLGEAFQAMTDRYGNPFALPMNLWFAWRHQTDAGHYERLGSQTFNNLRIDVGSAGDTRFLSAGWANPEQGDSSFRWSSAGQSSLLAPLKEAAGYTLRLVMAPIGRPDGERQAVEVVVNGATVETVTMASGMREYLVPIAPEHLLAGVNGVVFRYAWVASPAALGLSDDTRLLAVQFDRIELLRQ